MIAVTIVLFGEDNPSVLEIGRPSYGRRGGRPSGRHLGEWITLAENRWTHIGRELTVRKTVLSQEPWPPRAGAFCLTLPLSVCYTEHSKDVEPRASALTRLRCARLNRRADRPKSFGLLNSYAAYAEQKR